MSTDVSRVGLALAIQTYGWVSGRDNVCTKALAASGPSKEHLYQPQHDFTSKARSDPARLLLFERLHPTARGPRGSHRCLVVPAIHTEPSART